ncbi:MAG: serine/threonine protein kinase [Candidatus Scalindua rubra]|uniref:Serine/threonine protein kinase n=1 Tax=Candidatus Scalindua rubra TaxID=1872076 RepID=A0A1E3XDN4_9BACT|nr:MAG: serine/threonine protein kinase [Candidatus Scalindua rubra]
MYKTYKLHSLFFSVVNKMFKLGKYQFESFKYRPGHRANYAVLSQPGNREWGVKYSPTYSYDSEYVALKKFSHPQIPKRYDCGKEKLFENDKLVLKEHFIVLKHFEGEDIVEYYKQNGLPDSGEMENVVKYFASVADPLQYLHSNGYAHTDIKPGHLILDPSTGIVGLIDLELTIKIGEIIKGMTEEYASPEQKQMNSLLKDVTDRKGERVVLKQVKVDGRADLYSIGLLLYEVLTGKRRTKTNNHPIEINNAIPQKLNEIVMGLIDEDQSNRIPSAEILKEELASV